LKTFIQTEALGKILGSDASILEVTRPYARTLLQRGYDARSLMKNFGRDVRSMGAYMKTMPKYVNDILRQTAKGRQRVELRHEGFERLEEKFEKGVNRFTVGIIISASLIAAAMILNSTQRVVSVTIESLGLRNVSLTALLGICGYVVATVLGVWLIVSIMRSRKL
jgi:ubiquinone biosynthesis protein